MDLGDLVVKSTAVEKPPWLDSAAPFVSGVSVRMSPEAGQDDLVLLGLAEPALWAVKGNWVLVPEPNRNGR